ncbi:DUF2637 domain-containing protein [Actinoplanes xinjiangensis]|uniref:DUF2637 domain-containing protein n=1 Tax=Actinoplanes xinjiangensis TaxID=512350 RepID=UPI0034231D81
MTTTSLTQQFATEYAKRAVPGMLKAIRIIKLANKGIVVGAVAASYLHQAHFLQTLGAGIFSWIVPAVFDLAIVSMLTITQTIGMATDAKRAALKVLIVVVVISGAVNAAAPGPIGLRIIFALVVGLVAAVEWVAGKIRPDFTAIEHRETELVTATNHPTQDSPATAPANPTPVADTTPPQTPTADTTPQAQPAPEVPAHLLHTARFSIVQHEQTTGNPITVDDLAMRMSVTHAVAAQLLTAVRGNNPAPAPARLNGNTPALSGGHR